MRSYEARSRVNSPKKITNLKYRVGETVDQLAKDSNDREGAVSPEVFIELVQLQEKR
jgi:hypothetical protein